MLASYQFRSFLKGFSDVRRKPRKGLLANVGSLQRIKRQIASDARGGGEVLSRNGGYAFILPYICCTFTKTLPN